MAILNLTVDNLSFSYDELKILNNLNFQMQQGQIVGILGPNGSGKTTLLRCIAGILTPQEGSIFIDSKDIRTYKSLDLAKILSVVPQISRFTDGFSVFETVILGRYPHLGMLTRESEKDYQIVNTILKRIGILHLVNRNVTELSGGEKQLVAIAMALAQEPEILCLDEPTLHLDINMQYRIMELCKEFSQQGIGVMVVLHDLELAAQYCDHLIILKDGIIKASGTPDLVFTEELIFEAYNIKVVIGKDNTTGLMYILPRSVN